MTEPVLLAQGRGLVESPRWRDGRLWFADWTAGEILTLGEDRRVEVVARAAAPPLSFDFAADGRMLIVASAAGQLLRREADGSIGPFAELGQGGRWNEIVVDGRGAAYVNGAWLLLVRPDGVVEPQAEGFAFPNGMAVTPDNRTLICAESHARQLTAFDIAGDGRLSNRRIWASLDGPPDGICIDAEGAVWYADVPNRCCRRVREGGEVLDEVKLDRGAFACILGGPDRRTLYITAASWFGMDRMGEMGGTGRVFAVEAPAPGVGWP
ncbi:MAG TPA: SMP-30/gluconolactonase/LRE family protein [Caulobacteraceae bacterium]|jgi:sugar lactone lactonase YvrE|nr:SMP-30/gluconolactonase/LRE family protein [Caulobacteraceae bacterium]